MMPRFKAVVSLGSMLIVIACGLSLVLTSFAYALNTATLDLNAKGSISVTMREGESNNLVSGGNLSLYRVAEVTRDDANLSFSLLPAFEASGVSLTSLDDEDLALTLRDYALDHNVDAVTLSVPDSARVRFSGLPLGLYLVVQQTPAEGYNAVMPFLVTLPGQENDAWVLDVDATPKVETYTQAPASPPSSQDNDPSGDLPQTGQLKWPIPVLTGCGILLLLVGGILLFKRA